MYLMIGTRLDLAFAIWKLSQYFEKPMQQHWKAMKCIFHYIFGTQIHGMLFRSSRGNADIAGYNNSTRQDAVIAENQPVDFYL